MQKVCVFMLLLLLCCCCAFVYTWTLLLKTLQHALNAVAIAMFLTSLCSLAAAPHARSLPVGGSGARW
jgi:hypothetical protein